MSSRKNGSRSQKPLMKRGAVKLFLAGIVLMFAAELHAEFKVGFARVDATPPLGLPIVGYFKKRIADGVLDPLSLDCVAVSDGKNAGLIFSIDSLSLPGVFVKKAAAKITEATGVPYNRIYIHSSHTHTGAAPWTRPSFTDEENAAVKKYAFRRMELFAEAARLALADLTPSTIAVGETECKNVSFIRRYRMKDGSVITNPGIRNPRIKHPLGTPDESVKVIRFKRKGASDIAIVNFGTHPDTIGGTKYSADWPGVVRRTFENGLGGGVKCMFLNAAQGDVNHHRPFPPPGRAALRKKNVHFYMGHAVAGAAMGVWDVCEDIPAGAVRGIIGPCVVQQNLPTEQELKWVEMFDAGRKDEIPLGRMEILTLTGPNSRVRRLKGAAKTDTLPVTTLAIGKELSFVGLPCEPFVDIGRAIKKNSPFRFTVVTCLTSDSRGYVPTLEAHNQGGYEGLSARFAAPTADALVSTAVEQLSKMKKEE